MATIQLYANKINLMPELIKDVKKSVVDYKTELAKLSTKTLDINKSVCDLEDIAASIKTSSHTQERKVNSLETFYNESVEFISEVVRIDEEVADVINARKDNFYKQYYYLKPECEKTESEKLKDGLKSAVQWCKDHWKAVVTIALVVAAVVVLIVCPVSAVLLIGIAKK